MSLEKLLLVDSDELKAARQRKLSDSSVTQIDTQVRSYKMTYGLF